MLHTLLDLALAPLLVAAATLATRRWGARVGGGLSAFPAVVGPVLLIDAQQHGALFAARAAAATLPGLVAMSGFVLCYGRVARHAGWRSSLIIAWATGGVLAVIVGRIAGHAGVLEGLLLSTLALALAHRGLPRSCQEASPTPALRRHDLPLRMGLTTLLVGSLALAAGVAGPVVGGLLSALPVLASILAVFTHRDRGVSDTIALLSGMMSGMAGFVGFCAVVALLVVAVGIPVAFGLATLLALGVQIALGLPRGQAFSHTTPQVRRA